MCPSHYSFQSQARARVRIPNQAEKLLSRSTRRKKRKPQNKFPEIIIRKMSNFQWDLEKVQYTLREFDSGRTAEQIRDEFVNAGFNVGIITVEQTLRANGRNVDGYDASIRPSFTSNSYGRPGNQGPAYDQPGNQVTHQHLVRNDSYPGTWSAQGNKGFPPLPAPTRFAPQNSQPQGLHWDPQADLLAINAYRSGQSVLQIWSYLRSMGYVVNAAEVAASLSAQGVSGVHVADYLSL